MTKQEMIQYLNAVCNVEGRFIIMRKQSIV